MGKGKENSLPRSLCLCSTPSYASLVYHMLAVVPSFPFMIETPVCYRKQHLQLLRQHRFQVILCLHSVFSSRSFWLDVSSPGVQLLSLHMEVSPESHCFPYSYPSACLSIQQKLRESGLLWFGCFHAGNLIPMQVLGGGED